MRAEIILWSAIRLECAAWRQAGYRPLLWWRDDDARQPSASLERLLGLSQAYGAPLALAVIPDVDLSALATALGGCKGVRVIQHGCDHIDRNRQGGFSSEFNPTEPAARVAESINAAWGRLSGALEAEPVYAPPWNVLTPNVRQALRDTPFRAVSVYGAVGVSQDGLREINTHMDIMKWRPARFRGGSVILARLWRQLRARRRLRRWDEPIGLLTHHKNLDPGAWLFLEQLLVKLGRPGSGFVWRSVDQFL